jgi:hypothetical protein
MWLQLLFSSFGLVPDRGYEIFYADLQGIGALDADSIGIIKGKGDKCDLAT